MSGLIRHQRFSDQSLGEIEIGNRLTAILWVDGPVTGYETARTNSIDKGNSAPRHGCLGGTSNLRAYAIDGTSIGEARLASGTKLLEEGPQQITFRFSVPPSNQVG